MINGQEQKWIRSEKLLHLNITGVSPFSFILSSYSCPREYRKLVITAVQMMLFKKCIYI
jgi:hypothetical protein